MLKTILKKLPVFLFLLLFGGIIYSASTNISSLELILQGSRQFAWFMGIGVGYGSFALLILLIIPLIASTIGRGPYWGCIMSIVVASVWEWAQVETVKEGITSGSHGIIQGIILGSILILLILQIWGKIRIPSLGSIHLKKLFAGRVGRLQYFYITSIILGLGTAIMMVNQNTFLSLLISLLTIPITVKRLHDVGLPGFLAPIGLLSYLGGYSIIAGAIFNLYLIFKKGDKEENKYGTPYRGNLINAVLG